MFQCTMQARESLNLNVTIGLSSPGGSDCLDIASVGGSVLEYLVQLNCSYTGTSVTFCVQYTSEGCSSMQTRLTTLGKQSLKELSNPNNGSFYLY